MNVMCTCFGTHGQVDADLHMHIHLHKCTQKEQNTELQKKQNPSLSA